MLDLIRVTGNAIELLSVMLEETSPLAHFIAKVIINLYTLLVMSDADEIETILY